MRHQDIREAIYVPADQGTCCTYGAGLFPNVRMYFADTGEPVDSAIYVGSVNCDVEIGDPIKSVGRWATSNHL
jgi:hypothetical protein